MSEYRGATHPCPPICFHLRFLAYERLESKDAPKRQQDAHRGDMAAVDAVSRNGVGSMAYGSAASTDMALPAYASTSKCLSGPNAAPAVPARGGRPAGVSGSNGDQYDYADSPCTVLPRSLCVLFPQVFQDLGQAHTVSNNNSSAKRPTTTLEGMASGVVHDAASLKGLFDPFPTPDAVSELAYTLSHLPPKSEAETALMQGLRNSKVVKAAVQMARGAADDSDGVRATVLSALVNLAGMGGQDIVWAQGGYDLQLEGLRSRDPTVMYFAATGVQNMLAGRAASPDQQASYVRQVRSHPTNASPRAPNPVNPRVPLASFSTPAPHLSSRTAGGRRGGSADGRPPRASQCRGAALRRSPSERGRDQRCAVDAGLSLDSRVRVRRRV